MFIDSFITFIVCKPRTRATNSKENDQILRFQALSEEGEEYCVMYVGSCFIMMHVCIECYMLITLNVKEYEQISIYYKLLNEYIIL